MMYSAPTGVESALEHHARTFGTGTLCSDLACRAKVLGSGNAKGDLCDEFNVIMED